MPASKHTHRYRILWRTDKEKRGWGWQCWVKILDMRHHSAAFFFGIPDAICKPYMNARLAHIRLKKTHYFVITEHMYYCNQTLTSLHPWKSPWLKFSFSWTLKTHSWEWWKNPNLFDHDVITLWTTVLFAISFFTIWSLHKVFYFENQPGFLCCFWFPASLSCSVQVALVVCHK